MNRNSSALSEKQGAAFTTHGKLRTVSSLGQENNFFSTGEAAVLQRLLIAAVQAPVKACLACSQHRDETGPCTSMRMTQSASERRERDRESKTELLKASTPVEASQWFLSEQTAAAAHESITKNNYESTQRSCTRCCLQLI